MGVIIINLTDSMLHMLSMETKHMGAIMHNQFMLYTTLYILYTPPTQYILEGEELLSMPPLMVDKQLQPLWPVTPSSPHSSQLSRPLVSWMHWLLDLGQYLPLQMLHLTRSLLKL